MIIIFKLLNDRGKILIAAKQKKNETRLHIRKQEITAVGDWNLGSSLAIFMMILILISMAFMTKYEKKYAGKD